jgi:hypothetical protein
VSIRRVSMVILVLLATSCTDNRRHEVTDSQRRAIADTIRQQAAALYADENRRSAEVFIQQMSDSDFHYASTGNLFPSKDSLSRAARQRVSALRELTYTLRDSGYVSVLSPDAAVFTGAYDEVAVDSGGKKTTYRDAWTGVYERRNGKWVITHGHFSRAPVVDQQPRR